MNEQINDVERVFMAFADKTRLRLLHLLRNGEVSVNSLCDSLETSQPKVSRHLAYLRAMNMVTTRRDGKSIYYRLDMPGNPFEAAVVRETIEWLDSLSGSPKSRNLPKPEVRRVRQLPSEQPSFQYDVENETVGDPQSERGYPEQEMEVYLL